MARPKKIGLDYFPLDVDIFQDPKIIATTQAFGGKSMAVIIGLLCYIYKNKGYYAEYDENGLVPFLIARDTNVPENLVRQIVKFLLERSMFDNTLFQSDKILTSRRIQFTYQTGKTKYSEQNPLYVDQKYWLLNSDETKGFIKFTQNNNGAKNESFYTNNKGFCANNATKESKVKESKVNNSCSDFPQKSEPTAPIITILLKNGEEYPLYSQDITELQELYTDIDVLKILKIIKGWNLANPTKRKTSRGIVKHIHTWLSKEQRKAKPSTTINSNFEISDIEARRKELGL